MTDIKRKTERWLVLSLKLTFRLVKVFFMLAFNTYIKTRICLLYSAPIDFSMADMTLNTIKNAVTVFLFAVIIDNKEMLPSKRIQSRGN